MNVRHDLVRLLLAGAFAPCLPIGPTASAQAASAAITAPAARPAVAAKPAQVTWVKGQEAWLSVPSAGIQRRVFRGGQPTLDRGVVAHYVGKGLPAPVEAGDPGVYWLAGHRTTYGAPLAQATRIVVGDVITIQRRSGGTVRYRVTELMRTGTVISYRQFSGAHPERGRLLLQTCLSDTRRLLVVGELI